MEKNILNEIYRLKELMNLSIINEGRNDIITDIITSADKLFSKATANPDEKIFNTEIKKAGTDAQKIKNVFATNPSLAKKVIKRAIIDSQDEFFKTIEGRIVYYIQSGKKSNFIKSKIEKLFDSNVQGELKDEYLNYYDDLITVLTTPNNTKTAKQVFGREVTPSSGPTTKPKTVPNPVIKTTDELINDVKKAFPKTPDTVFDQIRILSNDIDKLKTDGEKLRFVHTKIDELTKIISQNKKLNREEFLNTIRYYKEAIITILPKIKNPKKWVLSGLAILAILSVGCYGRSVVAATADLFNADPNRWSEILRKICLASGNSGSESQPQETKPQETKPQETKPQETKPAKGKYD
jgi:hypothetical protein